MGEEMVGCWVYALGVRVRVETVYAETFVGSIPEERTAMPEGWMTTPGWRYEFRTAEVCPGCLEVGDESCPVHQAAAATGITRRPLPVPRPHRRR